MRVPTQWAIVVDAVGRAERLELDQTFLTSQYRYCRKEAHDELPQKTFTAGANFGGDLRGRQVNPMSTRAVKGAETTVAACGS